MNIIDKSLKDFRKLLTPSIIGICITGTSLGFFADMLNGKIVSWENIFRWIIAVVIMIFIGLVIIYLVNLTNMAVIKKQISISAIQSIKTPKQKLLLQISNNTNEDMTNIQIEFLKLLVDQTGNIESIIRTDNNFFQKGILEKENTITSHESAKIDILSNHDGVLRILTNDEYDWQALLGMVGPIRQETYRLVIVIRAKVGDFFYKIEKTLFFRHYINENMITIVVKNGTNCRIRESGLEWLQEQ